MNISRETRRAAGFTLSELLSSACVVFLLGFVILPAAARSGRLNHSALCLYNKKVLMTACALYIDDNRQQFPGMLGLQMAQGGAGASGGNPSGAWTVGALNWTTSPDNTNSLFLTNSQYSSLAGYLGFSQTVFKCPADGYLSDVQRAKGWTDRVRSIAGNGVIGAGNVEDKPLTFFYKHVVKLGDLQFPSPSMCWMYADEHPDSINDPLLYPADVNQFVDVPGNYHDGACAIVFIDGHTELHRWQTPEMRSFPVRFFFSGTPSATNPADLNWLRSRTPHKLPP